LFLCLMSSMASVWAVTFESSVDRKQIRDGESLLLTLRYNRNVRSANPDFSPLQQQFDIINQQRKSKFQFVNGQSDSWTIWTLHLMPKRLGNLVIPSLHFKGEDSQAIQIQVEELSASISNQQQKEAFFHTEVDVQRAYVQGQILYTEKLYFSVPLNNGQFNEVEVDEAVVQALGATNIYSTQLNGRTFDVYERNYVIYPQVSGEMIIPGPRYTGEVSNGRWRAGRPIRVSQPPLKIHVLPQPASYPAASWLPAQALTLEYEWRGNPHALTLGEPITLHLELKAKGLSQAQLPDIVLPASKGFKYYPDQAKTQDVTSTEGIIGIRSQSIAIVPTQTGRHTLPEIRIPWWNTQHGRLEYAVIPAQPLTTINNQPNQHNQPNQNEAPVDPVSVMPAPADAPAPVHTDGSLFWPALSGVLLLAWLATLGTWWLKNQPANKAATGAQPPTPISPSLKNIRQACRNNDARQARAHILSWARSQWQFSGNSLTNLAQQMADPALEAALEQLDHFLYSPLDDSWQGEYLWQLLNAHKPMATTKLKGSELTTIYPHETTKTQHG
ncbi:MAG: BatD family protein, partial [Bermanella sp.]